MTLRFVQKLAQAQRASGSDCALLIAPRLLRMPFPMQRYDDPFLPFGKAIITATQAHVCAYMFDLAAYLAIGAAGAVALERTLAFARVGTQVPLILHAGFWGEAYATAMSDNALAVDAVTLAREMDAEAYTRVGVSGLPICVQGDPFYDPASMRFGIDGHLFRVLGEEVLYAGRDDNFAAVVAQTVKDRAGDK